MSVGNSGLCVTTNNVSGTANYDAFAFTTKKKVGGILHQQHIILDQITGLKKM